MSPTTKKILAAVGVLLCLLVVGCVVLGVLGASWFRDWSHGLVEQGEQADAEAREFATGRDQNTCIDEALRRTDACGGTSFACEISASVFLQRCLDFATPVPGYCDDVPRANDIMAAVRWTAQTCTAHGHRGNQACTRVIPGVQRHCDSALGRGP